MLASGGRGDGRGRPGGQPPGTTEEEAALSEPADDGGLDPVARGRALEIARRLSLPRPRRVTGSRGGSGDVVSTRYRGGSDEIDLERTLEVLPEHPVPDDEDIVVRERFRTLRALVLAVDVSGSMKGERVRTAAATVGALSGELAPGTLAVVAFWSDAAVLLRLGEPARPMPLVDAMLRIPARGLTNVGFPLRVAAQVLRDVPRDQSRVVLLSDCVHNAGPDPRGTAAVLPRLDVLMDAGGEQDAETGRALARAGRGTFHALRDHRDVAPALNAVLGS